MDEQRYIGANIGTLDALARERIRLSPDSVAYRSWDPATKEWVDTTWEEMGQRVARWQAALRREDLDEGDRVALQLKNCVEWAVMEQAAIGLGLVLVPLYADDRPDNVAYILRDAGIKLLLLDNPARWNALCEVASEEELASLARVVVLAPGKSGLPDDERVVLAEDWLPAGEFRLSERGGDPGKLATIVYTSGTTGKPKGVMLSHRNILSIAESALEIIDMNSSDLLVSFLPLSHTYERTCGYYGPIMTGATVAFSRSVQQLADDLQIHKPTILISVPRIFERIYDRLQQQLVKKSFVTRGLFRATVRVGWKRFLREQHMGHGGAGQIFWPLLNRLVASKFSQRLGGRLRMAVSGGAALSPAVAQVFLGLGIRIIQGYGMTETSPIIATNRPHENRPDSVGKPLGCVDIRIGENEELLVRTPGCMLGYWNNHKATSEIIDPDGWLHTGDKVRIENDFIYITGRIKDILVLSNGEKVPPADMEAAITLDPWFEQAMVVGEGKPYLSALVVLNPEAWVGIARQHGLDAFDSASLGNSKLRKSLAHKVAQLLKDFPGYAKIRRITPLLEAWSIDNGMLTPTLKIKRQVVMQNYADAIEQMYA
ncbi:MAG TPA: long-chain fatty acid--CoA ligase [Gammaproteobacteria bacterium]|nr:long-chain fatty acid--CoA ligase [Gammaproteobacteria bacterium]